MVFIMKEEEEEEEEYFIIKISFNYSINNNESLENLNC